MKKRLMSYLCLLLVLTLIPLCAQAATVIRILDGKITTRALWNAFGGGDEYTAYHYRKSDATTGWKRVDGDALSDTALAENIVSGPEFTVEKLRDHPLNPFDGDWEAHGAYQFQTYYSIAVSQQPFPQGGGVSFAGGTKNGSSYEVNENADFSVTFNPVSGYEPQVQVGGESWQTLSGLTYTHKAVKSTTLALRYVKEEVRHKVTITVNDSLLGTYAGPETDRLATGEQFILTVTPFNEATTPANDRDAYVKSVTLNGVEMPGSYTGTVFKSQKQTVTGDMTIHIEFAPRLVMKAPTYSIQKYPTDPYTLEYVAKRNMDKAVSQQIPAIEASIYDSIINKEETPAFDPAAAQIHLEGVIDVVLYQNSYWLRLDQSIQDINGDSFMMGVISGIVDAIGSSNWGDISFNDEAWENIRITLPATGKYPQVVTGPLTVAVVEAREKLLISGTAQTTTVDSQQNMDAALKAAVQARLLELNPGVTQAQLNASSLAYTYTAPSFASLRADAATNVIVTVSLPKGDYFLASSGTVTVPVKRTDVPASVTVTTDGNGDASYTHTGDVYHLVMTPHPGYYVHSLTVTDNGTAGQPVAYTQMTPTLDQTFAYAWDLTTQVNHAYEVSVRFSRYGLTAQAKDEVLAYYEGLYGDTAALEAAILNELTLTPQAEPVGDFPAGAYQVEYLARKAEGETPELWLPLGDAAGEAGCHPFGAEEAETLRIVYTVAVDGFSIVSDPLTLNLVDERIATRIVLTKPSPIPWEVWAAMTEAERHDLMVMEVNDENNAPLDDNDRVTFTPALNSLSAGENQTLTAYYPGNAAYKPSTATTTLSLIPMDAQVTVTVKDNVVPYGTPYQITAQTQPAGLEKLVFAAGLDLSMMDPAQGSLDGMITTLHLMSPQGLREPLLRYLTTQDDDNQLTLGDLRRAAHTLSENAALAQQLGLSAASLRAVEEVLILFGSLADSLPLALTEDQPEDIGLYLVGAVIAQKNYAPDVDLALLAITPLHCRIDLDWKNQVSALSLHDLQTPNLLDAQVVRVEEGGSMADAARKLMHLFIGVDPHGQIQFANRQQDLVQGTYLQVALTSDWGNVHYACAPILRQISVGQQKVNLVFKDHRNQPVIELLHVMGRAPGARLEITYPDGTPVPQAKQDQFLSFSYISLLDQSMVEAITGPGLYLAIASYAEGDEAGSVTCAGAAPLLVVVTPQVKAFALQDVTVPYDGQPHFIDIQDANDPKLPYGALIVDKERKHLNLILPDELNSYEEALALLGQFQPMIQYLEENSQEGMLPLFLKNLLTRVQKDLYDTSDYRVEIGAPLPSQPGVYQVYVGAMGWLYPSQEDEQTLMTDKAILTILPPPAAPDTGDDTPLSLWLMLLASSAWVMRKVRRTSRT